MEIAFKKVRQQIDSYNYVLDPFETNQLFPEIVSRLNYIKSGMEKFQKICDDPLTAVLIDESVRQVVKPELISNSAPEPGVGAMYLQQIKGMIQDSFVDPINLLVSEEKKQKALESIEKLVLYFNESNHMFRSICDCEHMLFKYSFKNFVNIKNIKTGAVLVSPPEHLEIILTPFEVGLKEITNVSRTSILSIEKWAEQVRDRKSKFIELSVNASQIQVAEENFKSAQEQLKVAKEQTVASKEQSRAAQNGFYFQLAVIFFTVILVIGSYKLNLYLDKLEAENTIQSKLIELSVIQGKYRELERALSVLKKNEIELVKKITHLETGIFQSDKDLKQLRSENIKLHVELKKYSQIKTPKN